MLKKIISQLATVRDGLNNIPQSAIGADGYGFVFKDRDSDQPWIFGYGSSKCCDFAEEFMSLEEELLLAASIKTLVPTLKLGQAPEILFDVWLLIQTPDNYIFPTTFYSGITGPSIGGWDATLIDFLDVRFPADFLREMKGSIFDLGGEARQQLLLALKRALSIVPHTDCQGIYTSEFGRANVGVMNGKPYINVLEREIF